MKDFRLARFLLLAMMGISTLGVECVFLELRISRESVEMAVGETAVVEVRVSNAGGFQLDPGVSPELTVESRDPAVAEARSRGEVSAGLFRVEITCRSEGETIVEVTASDAIRRSTGQIRVRCLPGAGPDLSRDRTLQGTHQFETIEIPAGVTITASGNLELNAAGAVEIAGTLTGDCVTITINGSADVTITGTVENTCVDIPGSAPGLRILGNGAMTFEGALIASSGELEVANGTAPAGVTAAGRSPGGGLQPANGKEEVFFDRTTLWHRRVASDEPRARNGSQGPKGGDGEPGARTLIIVTNGDLVFGDDNVIEAQAGGHGGAGKGKEIAIGGGGGRGGDVLLVADKIVLDGTANLFISGDGGDGGPAEAINPDGEASATGGAGNIPGRIEFQGGVVFSPNVSVHDEQVGNAGDGGAATAVAGNGGRERCVDGRAESGHDAAAIGGPGGDQPHGEDGRSGAAGRGGDATVTAGSGADGRPDCKDGGAGGNALAEGGKGGDVKDNDRSIGRGGDGGDIRFSNSGNGGDGAPCCDPVAKGGDGGKGGNTAGKPGLGGSGGSKAKDTDGSAGKIEIVRTGNGGDAGEGRPPGDAGEAGIDNTPPAATTKLVDFKSFKPGEPADACPEDPPAEDPPAEDPPAEDPPPVDLELVISDEDLEMRVGEMTTVEIDLLIDGSPRKDDDDVEVITSTPGNGILEIRFLSRKTLKIICKSEGDSRVDVAAFHNPSGTRTDKRIRVRCLPPRIPTPDEIQGGWIGERGDPTTTGSCLPSLDPTWTGGGSNFGGGIVGMSGPDPDADPVVGTYDETTGEWTGTGSVVLDNGFRIETEITGKFSFDADGNVRVDGTMTRRHFDTDDNLVCTEEYPLTGQKSAE